MITILWTEHGCSAWEQCSNEQAEKLMNELIKSPHVNTEDIIIFFEDAFGCSSYGHTYNIPIGTVVKVVSEQKQAVVVCREITEIGVKYNVRYLDTENEDSVYDRNIELLSD